MFKPPKFNIQNTSANTTEEDLTTLYRNTGNWSLMMWRILEVVSYGQNYVFLNSYVDVLTPNASNEVIKMGPNPACPSKKRKLEHTHVHREDKVKTQPFISRGVPRIAGNTRGKRNKEAFSSWAFGEPGPLTSSWQTSGLQDNERLNFCSFKPPGLW